MANIIIPPEHQSAPKTVLPIPARDLPPTPSQEAGDYERGFGPCRNPEEFDEEMDLVQRLGKSGAAEYAELQRRGYGKSSNAMMEEALRQHTINEQKMAPYRWQGQGRWQGKENEAMRLVRIMHPHSIMDCLRRAGVAASNADPYEWHREQKMPFARWPKPAARLWLNSFVRVGRVGVNAWVEGEPKTITSLQYPYGPEFSVMRFDEYNVPTAEKFRGWRTAMLALITEGALSEREVERAFGPAEGPAASFYNQQLYQQRRISIGVARRDEGAA